jgi:hypothetical protein
VRFASHRVGHEQLGTTLAAVVHRNDASGVHLAVIVPETIVCDHGKAFISHRRAGFTTSGWIKNVTGLTRGGRRDEAGCRALG